MLLSSFVRQNRMPDFETVAIPHLNDLYRTAIRMVGDPARAEDVIQDVYLQAWKSFDQFEMGTNCKAWLYRILFNSVHHYRRKWFDARLVKEPEDILEAAEAPPSPLPPELSDKHVLAALDRIPEDYRAVVLLADVEEFAYKEVASILRIPIGTVMSRLSRARKLLRRELAGVAESYGIGASYRAEQTQERQRA
ncbi:MAG: sigma-70 family RNA polymerase sigma factor [Bryobacteraceae bacterium]